MRNVICWPLTIAVIIAVAGVQASPYSNDTTWKASEVVSLSDAIVVGHEADGSVAFTFEDWGDGGHQRLGTGLNLVVSESIDGALEPGTVIRFFERPPHVHDMTYIRSGEQLLFLRRMTSDEVASINRHLEHIPVQLPAEVNLAEFTDRYRLPADTWTFTSETFAARSAPWMSYVGFSADQRSGPLAAHLERIASVEQTKDTIISYIRDLIELRQKATEDPDAFDLDELDAFQQDVVQGATHTRDG